MSAVLILHKKETFVKGERRAGAGALWHFAAVSGIIQTSGRGMRPRNARKAAKVLLKKFFKYAMFAAAAVAAFWAANSAMHRAAHSALLDGNLAKSRLLLRFVVANEPFFFIHRGVLGKSALMDAFAETQSILREKKGWIINTGAPVMTAPAAADGFVYFGNNKGIKGGTVFKADAATGKIIWSLRIGGDIETKPLVVGDRVFVSAHDGLSAIDAATGKRLWFHYIRWAESSPAFATGAVFVGADKPGALMKIDAETGQLIYSVPTSGPVESSPVIHNGKVYMGCNHGYVYCFDGDTGKEIWRRGLGGSVESAPLVMDGKIFAGSKSGAFAALDAETGSEVWRAETGAEIWSGAAWADDAMVFGDNSHNVRALRSDTGVTIWTYDAETARFETTPAVHDGVAYIGCHAGFLHAIRVSDGKLLWRFLTGWDIDDSHPLIYNGLVIFGSTDGRVYALKVD